MKILFFYIDSNTSSGYSTGLGLASISGYLKIHGIETDLVYYKTNEDFKYALDKISNTLPDIIGFSSVSVNWQIVGNLSKEIKRRFPKIFQIYGGVHATLVPETLDIIKGLDAICLGYGEVPMLELCMRIKDKKCIYDIGGLWLRTHKDGTESIIKNQVYFPETNQDEFLNFDYAMFLKEVSRFPDFDKRSYRLEIIFNRSCPFSCTFCCSNRLRAIYGGRKFMPSPAASIEAIKKSARNTGLGFLLLHDDILTIDKIWFHDFIERYAREVGLPFECNLRAGCFDEQDMKLLKSANLRSAWIGIESGNDYIRNEIMKKGISREQIISSVKLLHCHGIGVKTQNIIGVPHETAAHFIDTININAECWPAEIYMLSIFYPYPKTELYDTCVRENLFNEQNTRTVERLSPILDLPYFPPRKIMFYFKNFKFLIRYQHIRTRMPTPLLPPLTDMTSPIISIAMRIVYIHDTIHEIARLILPSGFKRWIRMVFNFVKERTHRDSFA